MGLTEDDFISAYAEIVKDGKSDALIQRETARKWAARSIVCYRVFETHGDVEWLTRAESYRHEAIEHAAFADDRCATLLELQFNLEVAAKAAGVN